MVKPRPFIKTADLRRRFRLGENVINALDGVDLEVYKGELLCLMGPSGSGKTTLLNLIGGLDTPTKGRIIVDGLEISTLDDNGLAQYRQKMVGFVFQSFNLIPSMTALQNVEYPMIFSGLASGERIQRAKELLALVGLEKRLSHKPTELSGGQQQRVAIARALVNNPQIVLGDEPTGNLDSKTGEEIMSLLTHLNRNGQTIVLVTHDPRVTQHASRTVHMLDGRIISEEVAPI